MADFFTSYSTIIIFLHLLSAIVWIGGMIVIRFIVHYSIQKIEEPKLRLNTSLTILKRFFYTVIFSIILLLITAIIMVVALNLSDSIVIIKEFIWAIMTVIFIYIYIKRLKAQKAFNNLNFLEAKKQLAPLTQYLIPINIILGLLALTLGVTLRGF